jgi:hypothetical protein
VGCPQVTNREVAWWGEEHPSLPLRFAAGQVLGMTVAAPCPPEAAQSERWRQMLGWLIKHPSTGSLSLDWLTTMEHQMDSDVCFDC